MKLFTLLVFATASTLAHGQDYKPVKVGIGFGARKCYPARGFCVPPDS